MKHIRLFEEYTRTAGFRYSEPTITFQVDFKVAAKFKKYDLSANIVEALSDVDAKCEGLFRHKNGLQYTFGMSIYNEKEIDSIIDEFRIVMGANYDIAINPESVVIRKAPIRIPVESSEEVD